MDDWKKWRSEGLGASDAPVVMGVSPWATRYQLWEEKTGIRIRDQSNWATKRGNDLEPKARANYELVTGLDMPVAFVSHKEFPFIRASLDGWNAEADVVLEIKCPGKDDHQKALDGIVPEKYVPQLQHQLLATGASRVDYYSFDGEQSFALIPVLPDPEYIEKLLAELSAFWALVQTRIPPELSDRDAAKIDDPNVVALAESWKAEKSRSELAASDLEEARANLIAAVGIDHPRVLVGQVSLTRVTRAGNVDYKKVPGLAGVDLEKYRGKSSTSWTIKEGKT